MDIKSTELLRTSCSWDGVELPLYPEGKPELKVCRMVFPAGAKTGWHHHTVINYGIIQQGSLTIVCVDGTERTFCQGEAMAEVVGTVHRGENRGNSPVVLDMFYVSSPGTEVTVQHPELN
ncbi:MAG: cupin domain-containing protein [Paludibacteraceae bacterium]|nr:cupin domain-containing protein [Paludibacteraceae bacterium]